MKVALITDTHWGARKSAKYLQDYFDLFYQNVFFPTLEKENINTIIHLGDAFDNRKSMDYQGLKWTQDNVLDSLSKYDVHLIVGNHDVAYKNTNKLNSPDLLLQKYTNIKIYSHPQEVLIDNLKIVFLPWINIENESSVYELIKNTTSKVVMGHLELNGFSPYIGQIMADGRDPEVFYKFKRVFSGHYHTRSTDGRIYYIGNPYEMFFNDIDDRRGFAIFDTETLDHVYVDNPYKLHYNVYYSDNVYEDYDFSEYSGKIVKLIIQKKTDPHELDKVINGFYSENVVDLKIVESFVENDEHFNLFESEETIDILLRYVKETDLTLNKSKLEKLITEIYKEAHDIV